MKPERLALLNRDRISRPRDGVLLVEEIDVKGEARVTYRTDDVEEAISFGLSHQVKVELLQEMQSADGHILYRRGGRWHALVIECKKKINQDSWEKAERQLAAGIVRLRLVADLLGVALHGWTVGVAYRFDTLATNPVLLEKHQRSALRWRRPTFAAPLDLGEVPLHKYELDADGLGAFPLP